MALKLKKQGTEVKKVLIYGLDGSGKSTFAEQYCQKHNLNPVVIDIDDTNFTSLRERSVVLDLKNDIKAYNEIKATIKDPDMKEYDTIILDGVSNLLELLTPSSGGQSAYKVRADRWGSILRHLTNSNKHLIFIGQIDMEVIFNDEFQSPKPIIKINSIVNEKYLTKKDGNNFSSEMVKYRGSKDKRGDKTPTPKPKQESLADIPEPSHTVLKNDEEISKPYLDELSNKSAQFKTVINDLKNLGKPVSHDNISEMVRARNKSNPKIADKLIDTMDDILRG